MSTQGLAMGQRTPVERTLRPRESGWVVPVLCALFVLSWALDAELVGQAASIVPPIRWVIIVSMCLATPFVSMRGISRGWSIVFFLGTLGFTVLCNGAFESSFPIYARILGAGVLALFAGTLALSDRVKIARFILIASAGIVIGSVVLAVVAPDRAFRLIGLERERLYGLTPHPGIMGYFASLVATVFGSSALFSKRSTMLRLRDGIIAGLGAVAVFLADSRTGEIALGLSLLCQFGMTRLVKSGWLRRSIVLPWVLFASFILASTILPIAVATDAIPISVREDQYSGSTSGRIAIWRLGLSDFENNMVVGNGLGTTFATEDLSADKNLLFYYHSVLINYLAKSGIVGAIGLVTLLLSAPFVCLAAARRVARQRSSIRDELSLLRFALAACTVTVAFASVEAALQNLYPSFLMYFLCIALPSRATA